MSNVGFVWGVYMVAIVITVILESTTIWVGLDQRKYKDANGFMWVIVNAIFPPIGWIGYLINRHMVKKDAKRYAGHTIEV